MKSTAFCIDTSGGSAEARIKPWGIHIWALVGYWQAADGDVEMVARDYAIPLEAVHAALAYYQEHQAAIDARIEMNAA